MAKNKAPHISHGQEPIRRDSEWIKDSFMLPHKPGTPWKGILSEEDKKWLYYTSAQFKFTTTGLGGNFVVNPPPKYTRYADIPTGTLVDGVVNATNQAPLRDRFIVGGMGRYYSETLDDNSYNIHMRFGVPKYKGLVTFFTGFFDKEQSRLGREGRLSEGVFFRLGKLIGTAVILPLTPLIFAYKALHRLLNTPDTSYYSSKPAMALYWSRVNMIALEIAMNKGLIPRGATIGDNDEDIWAAAGMENNAFTKDQYRNQYDRLRKLAPHWFPNGGTSLDIQAIIGQPQVIHRKAVEQLQEIAATAKDPDELNKTLWDTISTYGYDKTARATPIEKYMETYQKSQFGNKEYGQEDPWETMVTEKLNQAENGVLDSDQGGSLSGGVSDESRASADEAARMYASNDGKIRPVLVEDAEGNIGMTASTAKDPSIMEYAVDMMHESNQWLNLRVDAIESVSESFSNSTVPSEIQSKINSFASSNQAARFSLSDFNTGFQAIDTVVKTVRDLISGIGSGLQLEGIIAMTGAAFVDIPERYDNSSASMPSSTYTMELRAPYGDPLSQFINIDVPLACLLAAALPISHGNQAYGAPFLCELYVRGHNAIRLGMIDSLQITRGTGNMAWTPEGTPLGVDVSFTVKNLSSVLHAPITPLVNSLNPLKGILPRDNAWNDYMAVLGNMSVADMTSDGNRILMNWAKKSAYYKYMISNANIASTLMDRNPVGRAIAAISRETGNRSMGVTHVNNIR